MIRRRTPASPIPPHRLLAIAFTLLLAACSGKRTPTTPITPPPPPSAGGNRLERIFLSRFPSYFVLPTTIDSAASLLLTMNLDGVPLASGALFGGLDLVHAGDVFVWQTPPAPVPLDTLYFAFEGRAQTLYTTLKSNPDGIPLAFDAATYHTFDVEGSAGFPAVVDSIRSTSGTFVTEPTLHGFYPRANDLLVAWSNPGTDTTVYVTCTLVAFDDSTRRIPTATVRDVDGQLAIPTAKLQEMGAGHIWAQVARYRLSYRDLAGRKVGLLSMVVVRRPFYLL